MDGLPAVPGMSHYRMVTIASDRSIEVGSRVRLHPALDIGGRFPGIVTADQPSGHRDDVEPARAAQ